MAERHPKTLYHYCSIETFFNVIKSNSVWLSDIEKSNDSLELTYMKNEYANCIKAACLSFAEYHKKNAISYDERRLNALLQILTNVSTLAIPITKTWVFCLSEKGDLLSQWRGYADDGYGVSIGFDTKHLFHVIDSIASTDPMQGLIFFLSKINYSEKEMKEEVQKLISPTECGKCETLQVLQEKLTFPIAKIEGSAPYYKSESFKEEKEWRIALTTVIGECCDYTKLHGVSDLAALSNFDYIHSNKKLISHFELIFADLKKAINKIILGPKCKVSVEEMRYFLISKGLLNNIDDRTIEIQNSSSSYR